MTGIQPSCTSKGRGCLGLNTEELDTQVVKLKSSPNLVYVYHTPANAATVVAILVVGTPVLEWH